MPHPQLTPEQSTRLDKKARQLLTASMSTAVASWLLLAAAIWFGSWRLAGLGFLVAMPALAFLVLSVALRSPAGRQDAARQLNVPERPPTTRWRKP
ncbi:hypothetical protein Ssi03_62320 [Sphaerisporangium siamense]|uniref:Putative membrane protein n=1 Tax=Sphaerisporangium siamense TaxID=795645 RepID=A0A7W7DBX7_9ACTN|nr:hypothetical protein [Sphaerisporangium siamense]MBB4702543.1 putative membrane protein [Sphaerisporangium siamense]GII88242.1 hypothetical protein Ssi03_62320 [Sphaerisporangium siamense]